MLRRSRAAIGAAALAVACGQADPSDWRDAAGYAVERGAPAARIVSLSPSLTELVFAIGAGDRLVGRTRWCTEPAAAAAVPSVGDGLEPNLETIVARRPDLVVFYHSASNTAAIERLRAMNIATVSVRMDRLEDVAAAARLLAEVVGAVPNAANLADTYEADLGVWQSARSGDGVTPSVLMLAWDTPPIVIGGGSYLSQMVELAGGRNLFADLPAPSATVSIETIAARDPDLVLFIGDADPAIVDRPEWQAVPAVRERRFVRAQGTQFSWPSFRSLAGVAQLAEALGGATP